jgi:hypothetical protein
LISRSNQRISTSFGTRRLGTLQVAAVFGWIDRPFSGVAVRGSVRLRCLLKASLHCNLVMPRFPKTPTIRATDFHCSSSTLSSPLPFLPSSFPLLPFQRSSDCSTTVLSSRGLQSTRTIHLVATTCDGCDEQANPLRSCSCYCCHSSFLPRLGSQSKRATS